MGLAKAVAVRFPDWGPDFVFLMVRPLYAHSTLHLQMAVPPVCPSWTTLTTQLHNLNMPFACADVSHHDESIQRTTYISERYHFSGRGSSPAVAHYLH